MRKKEGMAVHPGAGEKPRKKNFRLYQSKIDRAKEALEAETETQAIDQALDFVIFRDELISGVRAMRGTELIDIFADAEE